MELRCQQQCKKSSFKEDRSYSVVAQVAASRYNSFQGGKKVTGKKEEHQNYDSLKDSSPEDHVCRIGRSITDLPTALVAEILQSLEPKELGIVSCVSTILNRVTSEHQLWKEFYCKRWGLPSSVPGERSWKNVFMEREFRAKVFMGRYSMGVLYGHTEAVRSVFILPFAKLIFTGGYDSVVRMWDMDEEMLIMSSRPLGCTIRALIADTELLVVGGTNGFLHCWRATKDCPHLFDIANSFNASSDFRLWEHEGPVTCLSLDSCRIYSGSWDMSVRIWNRAQMKCVQVLRHADWVWSLVPCGSIVAASAGMDVYLWNVEDGTRISSLGNAHVGKLYALAWSRCGDLLFTGGEDGEIHMYELLRYDACVNIDLVATWAPHTCVVYSLAFEFPWLVSSSADGKLALIDVRKLIKSKKSGKGHRRLVHPALPAHMEPPQRMLHGFGPNLFSVNIGGERIVCGGEEGVVRVWNFSQALDIENRAQTLKRTKKENRMRRKIQTERNRDAQANHCSYAAKRSELNGESNDIWKGKRVSGKLKA